MLFIEPVAVGLTAPNSGRPSGGVLTKKKQIAAIFAEEIDP
jgi:hypothetical protein